MKRMNRYVFPMLLFICFCIFFSLQTKVSFAESVSSTAKAVCVIETTTSRKLYTKNETQKLPMASTTKIVTALTVLNNCDNIDKEFVIDDRAVGIPGTSIYLKKNEVMTVRELLYGMMLPSGNDSATALAYHISKDIPTFCELMQKTAIECGAYNSSFDNPHGLDSPSHYTTAYDLGLITSKALQNPIFREIVTTKATRIRGATPGTYRYLKNKNKLLNTLDGCEGVKTGYTGNAGRCLVSACNRNGLEMVCVVLNCGPMFEESAEFLNKAYQKYKMYTILPSYKVIRRISVNEGRENSVKTYTQKGFEYPLTEEEYEKITYTYDLPKMIQAPVEKNQIVGKINVYLDNCLLFSEKIYTMDSVKKIGVWSNIRDIISEW